MYTQSQPCYHLFVLQRIILHIVKYSDHHPLNLIEES